MQFEHGIGAGASVIHSSRRRWLITLMAFLLVTGLILIAPPADAQVSPVNPPSYEGNLAPGESVTIDKTVVVPDVPPMLDVCLLVDLSGSYSDDLVKIKDSVERQGLAGDLWDALDAVSDLKMGLASFVDYPTYPWGAEGDYAYQLNQQLTTDKNTWLLAVNSMILRNGGDGPESQYEGLYEIASGCAWRPDASKFVVITTDAPFHTPVDDGKGVYTEEYPGASRDDAVAALTGAGVKVIAVKAPGATSEMDDIADVTGGSVQTTDSESNQIASAIITGLSEVMYEITADTNGCAPLVVTFGTSLPQQVEAGGQAILTETIAVPEGTPGGTYDCGEGGVVFLADDSPIGNQHVTITVPIVEEPDVQCPPDCGFEDPDGNWTGSIVCEDCDVSINEPGPGRFVDLTIEPDESEGADPSFVLTLIREDRPRTWLRTARLYVSKDLEQEPDDRVARCSLRETLKWFARGQEPDRNCSIIVPLRHDRLKYILFYNEDPRMSGS